MADPSIPDTTQAADKDPPLTTSPDFGALPTADAAWKYSHDIMSKDDKELIDGWNDDIDTLLILAGLFSAVVTAFVIESYQSLQEDPNASSSTVLLLSQILHQLNNTAPQIPTTSTFQAPSSAVRLNIFWFLSLVLALVSALFSLVVKQWLREYLRSLNGASAQLQVRVRQAKYSGLLNWHVPEIVSALSLLLQGAVILFMIGLVDFLFQLTPQVAQPILAFSVLFLSLLVLSTLMPCISFTCPYRSPLSRIVLGLLHHVYILACTLPYHVYIACTFLHHVYILVYKLILFPWYFDTWLNHHHLTGQLPFISSNLNLLERIQARMYGLFIMILLKPFVKWLCHSVPRLYHSVPRLYHSLSRLLYSALKLLQPVTIWESSWVARDSSVFSEQSPTPSSKAKLIQPELLHSYDVQALKWIYDTSLDPMRLLNTLTCAVSVGPQAVDDWLLMWMNRKAEDISRLVSYHDIPPQGAMDHGALLKSLIASWGSATTDGILSKYLRCKILDKIVEKHGLPDGPNTLKSCLSGWSTLACSINDPREKSDILDDISRFLQSMYMTYQEQHKPIKQSDLQVMLTWTKDCFKYVSASSEVKNLDMSWRAISRALSTVAPAIKHNLDVPPCDIALEKTIVPALNDLWKDIIATCTGESHIHDYAQTSILEALTLFHAHIPHVLKTDLFITYLHNMSFDQSWNRFYNLTQLALLCALRLGTISRDEVDKLRHYFHPPSFQKMCIALCDTRHEETIFEHAFQCVLSWCRTQGLQDFDKDDQRALGLLLSAYLKYASYERAPLYLAPQQQETFWQLYKQLKGSDPEQGLVILADMIKLVDNVRHIVGRSKSLPDLQIFRSGVNRRMTWPPIQSKRASQSLCVPNNTPRESEDPQLALQTLHYQISDADSPLRIWSIITSEPGNDKESERNEETSQSGTSITPVDSPSFRAATPATVQDIIPDVEASSQNPRNDSQVDPPPQRQASYSSDDINSMEEGASGVSL